MGHGSVTIAQSGQLDALVALELVGTRHSYSRNDEIYAESDRSDCWYKVARLLRDTMLRDLANAHEHMLLLGRMTAPERVASFLLEMFDRRDRTKILDLPMSRNDIADYLGLTIKTVCRVLSVFKRDGAIAIRNPHRIELRNRDALAMAGET